MLTNFHLLLSPSFYSFFPPSLSSSLLPPPPHSLLCHVDHSLWRGVAGGGEVVHVSLHADGLEPVLNCAHGRARLWAAGLQQGGVGPVVGGGGEGKRDGKEWRIILMNFGLGRRRLHFQFGSVFIVGV